MSDTTTPSAAEVMGWRWLQGDGAKWFDPATEQAHRNDPTPDDMLAWLSAHVVDGGWNTEGTIGINYERDGDTGHVEVQWYCAAGSEMVSAPTLHAALEAAVIAVGRAE